MQNQQDQNHRDPMDYAFSISISIRISHDWRGRSSSSFSKKYWTRRFREEKCCFWHHHEMRGKEEMLFVLSILFWWQNITSSTTHLIIDDRERDITSFLPSIYSSPHMISRIIIMMQYLFSFPGSMSSPKYPSLSSSSTSRLSAHY